MKKKFFVTTSSFALSLFVFSNAAFATQIITCSFVDPTNPDQVQVVLTTTQAGTFLYSVGAQNPSASTDARLILTRGTDVNTTSVFSIQSTGVSMSFKLPQAQILQTGVSFKATLSTQINALNSSQDQDLNCNS